MLSRQMHVSTKECYVAESPSEPAPSHPTRSILLTRRQVALGAAWAAPVIALAAATPLAAASAAQAIVNTEITGGLADPGRSEHRDG